LTFESGVVFDGIGEDFFSSGTDESYYSNFNRPGIDIRDEILLTLRDISAFENKIPKQVADLRHATSVQVSYKPTHVYFIIRGLRAQIILLLRVKV
jgi:hypothetical protein